MADVITFPNALIVSPSLVDPPEDTTEPRSVILDLEHEIAELQYVVARQALQIHRRMSNRMSDATMARRWRFSAAILLAFASGWAAEDTPLICTTANAATAQIMSVLPDWSGGYF